MLREDVVDRLECCARGSRTVAGNRRRCNLAEQDLKMQGTCFLVDLTIGEDGTVEEWFLGNWPQGDYTQFFAQFDS